MRSRLFTAALLGLLVACAPDGDAVRRGRPSPDRDGDGAPAAVDCDEADAAVFPGATEVCNGVDDDCDGAVDQGAADAVPWYLDADLDGWGGAETVVSCLAPGGAVEVGGDCDDGDADVFPGAPEVCDEADDDCDGLVDEDAEDAGTWYADADADGFGDADSPTIACDAPADHLDDGSDCDDADASVRPDAVEACNGIDDDCDELVDEDGWATVYADADADGWGDADRALQACPGPEGFVGVAGDCDDTDASALPGGVEVCNGADDDCDGRVDVDAADAATWYADLDGDSFGDAATAQLACDAPAAHVADATDCDDGDAAVNPGAVETCDGVDQDCDAAADDDAADATTWYADADGDGYGDAASATVVCDAPASAVTNPSDCDDATAAVNPDGVETCDDGVDDDCDGVDTVCGRLSGTVELSSAAALVVSGEAAGDLAGWAVAFAGDLDEDGLDDVVIGAPESDESGAWDGGQGGAVYAFTGGHAGEEPVTWADITLLGRVSERAGLSLAAAGDLWMDGRSWVIVGSMGTAWVIPDPFSEDLSDAYGDGALVCYEDEPGDLTGWAVAAADDADADAFPEHLVGAPYNDDGGTSAGKVYRGCEWYYSRGYWSASHSGEAAGDLAGAALADGGDLDGDGLGDFLVGAPYNDDAGTSAGKAYAVLGGGAAGDLSLATADASWTGISAGDLAGLALWGGADLDDDGYDDLAVGSGGAGAWVLLGPIAGGAGSLSDADAWLLAEDAGDAAGWDVAGGGDVDGDGVPDLVVAAPGSDRGAEGGGAVYVVAGPLASGSRDLGEADAFLVLDEVDAAAGWSIDASGDADGDGVHDVLIGAPGLAGAGAEAGGALLLLGGP